MHQIKKKIYSQKTYKLMVPETFNFYLKHFLLLT